MVRRVIAFAATALLAATPVWCAGITGIRIHGNQYIAALDLPGVEGLITLTFEELGNPFDATSLEIDAQLVVPTDPAITARLPGGYFVPARFPVLIHIVPGSDPGTTVIFDGRFTIEIETPDLEFESRTPFRLLKAPDGGAFEDISMGMGIGSFRVRGASGAFSEFVLAADLRRPDQVVEGKFQGVLDTMDAYYPADISPTAYANLDTLRTQALEDFRNGDLDAAIAGAEAMDDEVVAQSGTGITDGFDGTGTVSVAGILRGVIGSLRLSLVLYRQSPLPETAVITEEFDLPSGRSLTVELSFEDAQALELRAFTITAEEVDPFDPDLLARLPVGVTVPAEFPVLVDVDHGPAAAQAFRGTWSIELETDDLGFHADTPLRLFKAANATAPFQEISNTMALGSFRVLGASGAFSQFMILSDLRSLDAVVGGKYTRLNALMTVHQGAMDPTVAADLQALLDQGELDYLAGFYGEAVAGIDEFLGLVAEQAGAGVPDIWHISDGRVNVTALLNGAARTLRFSLVLKRSPPAVDQADANRDGNVDILDV
ncbi:MAG: hypothetical protein GY856_27240, partial [bacterium]|nr:hypothetical protein [bacterium]